MKNIYKVITYFILIFIILLTTAAAIYGIYYLRKTVNYSILYEDKVEETVCRMVKPEYLVKPCKS